MISDLRSLWSFLCVQEEFGFTRSQIDLAVSSAGLDVAKNFILTQTRTDLAKLAEEPVDFNPKGDLQELLQSISPRSPAYELVSQSGPEHEKTFVSEVVWEGVVLGQGTGRSKKQAETAAALEALQLRRWEKKPEAET